MESENHSFHQSHMSLIFRLILFEIILLILYLALRVPKSLFLQGGSDPEFFSDLNWIAIIYFIGLSVFQLIGIVLITLNWVSETYLIKENIIIHRKGLFNTTENTYSLQSLGSTTILQGILGKLLNYGTIKIYSPILKREFYLVNVHNPQQKVKLLEDELAAEGKDRIIPRRG